MPPRKRPPAFLSSPFLSLPLGVAPQLAVAVSCICCAHPIFSALYFFSDCAAQAAPRACLLPRAAALFQLRGQEKHAAAMASDGEPGSNEFAQPPVDSQTSGAHAASCRCGANAQHPVELVKCKSCESPWPSWRLKLARPGVCHDIVLELGNHLLGDAPQLAVEVSCTCCGRSRFFLR